MKIPEKLPIKYQENWHILDTSKINNFMSCPRQFFYQYVLGWRGGDPSIHLEFGSAFHEGMEVLITSDYSQDAIAKAFDAFYKAYKPYITLYGDTHTKKNCKNALEAYLSYSEQYQRVDTERFEVLHTEVGGKVPIDEDRLLAFRCDGICRTLKTNKVFALEHKTASRNDATWHRQWDTALQVGTYNHVLFCAYSDDHDVDGVLINGIFFYTKKIDFSRVSCKRNTELMTSWLYMVNYYWDMIEWNFQLLSEAQEDDSVMRAFPMNPGSCTKWGRACSYMDFCTTWSNPLKRCHEVPPGMVQKFWNPLEKPVKSKFEDNKIERVSDE